MFEIVLEVGAKAVINKAGNAMIEAYRNRINQRVSRFFEYLDTAYERITHEDLGKLHQYIESEQGQELLADYVDVITKTSSKRAQMAMVLIYCDDNDLKFSDIDKVIFVKALESIDDLTIDMFLKCIDVEVGSSNETPYSRSSINNTNYKDYDINGWGQAGISIYVNDLIQRRLLLPDPKVGAFASAGEGGWAVWFGVSSKSTKFAFAFKKAQALIDALT